ncbi:Pilin (bacterial filament) [compost metagenome]
MINQGGTPATANVVPGGGTSTSNCALTVTGVAASGAGSIVCTLQNAPGQVQGKTITLTRDGTTGWSCASTVAQDYVPKGCIGSAT